MKNQFHNDIFPSRFDFQCKISSFESAVFYYIAYLNCREEVSPSKGDSFRIFISIILNRIYDPFDSILSKVIEY